MFPLDLLRNKLIRDPNYLDNEANLPWIENADWEYRTTIPVSAELFNRRNIEPGIRWTGYLCGGVSERKPSSFFGRYVSHVSRECEAIPEAGRQPASGRVYLACSWEQPRMRPKTSGGRTSKSMSRQNNIYEKPPTNGTPAGFGTGSAGSLGRCQDRGSKYSAARCDGPVGTHSGGSGSGRNVDTSATVKVDYEIDGRKRRPRKIQSCTLASIPLTFPLRLKIPKFWYPAGYGSQPLYSFHAEVAIGGAIQDSDTVRTGLRSVELRRMPTVGTVV